MSIRRTMIETAAVVSLACAIACAPAPRVRPVKGGPVDEGAGTLTAARKYLEGRWSLETFDVFPPGQAPISLKGDGTLSYDEFGNLQIDIRTDEKSADLLRAAGIDIRDNRISSSGRTAVDMQNRTLTYMVGGQTLVPTTAGPLALSRPRHWEVEADRLTLTTKDEKGQPLSVGRWRRMP